jgi:5-methylcytosine-specific restriction endonuclease McrA
MAVTAPAHLMSLAEVQATRRATPKGAMVTRVEEADEARKLDEKQLAKFRAAVWKRDEGKCRICRRLVKRTLALDPLRGEVHHLRGRNVAPEDRYNVKRALLLCLECHGKAGRKEVKVPKP